MEPLTAQMTEEKLKKKLEQQKAKAPPPGTSRILTRAVRDKNKPAAAAQAQKPSPIPPLNKQQPPKQTTTEDKQPAKKSTSSEAAPVRKSEQPEAITAANDEWANLADELNPETNPGRCEEVMHDEALLLRLKQRFVQARSAMLESRMEGAAMFREVCKILCSLLSISFGEGENDLDESTLKADDDRFAQFQSRIQMLEDFCRLLEIPETFLALQNDLLATDKAILKEVSFA